MTSVNFKWMRKKRKKLERKHPWRQTVSPLTPRTALTRRKHRDDSNNTSKENIWLPDDVPCGVSTL